MAVWPTTMGGSYPGKPLGRSHLFEDLVAERSATCFSENQRLDCLDASDLPVGIAGVGIELAAQKPPANPEPEAEAAQSRKRSARSAANTTPPES